MNTSLSVLALVIYFGVLCAILLYGARYLGETVVILIARREAERKLAESLRNIPVYSDEFASTGSGPNWYDIPAVNRKNAGGIRRSVSLPAVKTPGQE